LAIFDHHFRAFSKLNRRFCFTKIFVLGGNKAQAGYVMADLLWLDKVWCNYQGKAAAQAGPPTASARREGDRGMLGRGSGWLSPAGGDEEIFYSRLDGGGLNPAFAGVTIKEAGVTNEKREKGPGMTFLRWDDRGENLLIFKMP
jgi:hypothetical protein